MKRSEYNKNILDKCVGLLRSRDTSEVYQGIILAAYLIEQAFKSELRRLNPLLYFDRKSITDEMEILISAKKLSEEETRKLKTAVAKRTIAQICEYREDLRSHRANLEDLFEKRNFILHSTDDLPFDENSIAETAVSALRACRKYLAKYADVISGGFNPLTSDEFEKLQERQRKKRLMDLKNTVKEHKEISDQFGQKEIEQRIQKNIPRIDNDTWIEETIDCPACLNNSLDKIGWADFEWEDGVVSSYGGFGYRCRVCGLELSEYEYSLVS